MQKVIEKLRPFLAPVLTLAAIYVLFDYVHYIGIAHAQAVDPSSAITAAGDQSWDVFVKDGPAWAAVLLLNGLLKTFLSKKPDHWLSQGKLLSVLTGVSMILAAVVAWHFAGAPASGIMTAVFAAWTLYSHSTVPQKPAANGDGGGVGGGDAGKSAAAVLSVLLLGSVAVTQASCSASTKGRVVNGATAALNCESDSLKPLVAELVPIATSYVLSLISSDGKAVDTNALSKAWSGVKSDQGRCALATAIAVLADPVAPKAGVAMAAGLEVDSAALKAAYLEVRVQHGWGETVTAAGTL